MIRRTHLSAIIKGNNILFHTSHFIFHSHNQGRFRLNPFFRFFPRGEPATYATCVRVRATKSARSLSTFTAAAHVIRQ